MNEGDLSIFFEHQVDPAANHMAAFTAKDPSDRDSFLTHWRSILATESITVRTILVDGQVAGHVLSFLHVDRLEVSYWIAKSNWGNGVATKALAAFLDQVKKRPVYARAAKDNRASLRVLEKNEFKICGEAKDFANARGQVIEEAILVLW